MARLMLHLFEKKMFYDFKTVDATGLPAKLFFSIETTEHDVTMTVIFDRRIRARRQFFFSTVCKIDNQRAPVSLVTISILF